MAYDFNEVIETLRMTEVEHFDIRTVTLGVSLRDCATHSLELAKEKIRTKIMRRAEKHLSAAAEVEHMFGIRIANKRLSITPLSIPFDQFREHELIELGVVLDRCAEELGVDFIGGYSALVEKGMTDGELALIRSVPEMMRRTKHICSSINVATTKAGINMNAVYEVAKMIKHLSAHTPRAEGCCKFVAFCNVPEDNPFVAGAFHGISEPDVTLNVGISGPGVVLSAIREAGQCDFPTLAEVIKRTAFKITRAGELIGRKVAEKEGIPFGIVDISLAPTPAWGDSIAEILEAIGVEAVGAPGTTAALMLLNDSVKKGGMMASAFVGGMSGAFIPVSEDAAMIRGVEMGSLSIEKLEAMTSVCCVGLDMVAVPGDTSAETLAGIIADECAIGVSNNKTTAVRIIVPPGAKVGDTIDYGGLLGKAIIMPVSQFSSKGFVTRGGRIPATTRAMSN
ncbi:MAG: PFL family protein [Chloroherpetonaceae bacterium]|nr:PFL family protein [Chloroherpetonaceae bacterium]